MGVVLQNFAARFARDIFYYYKKPSCQNLGYAPAVIEGLPHDVTHDLFEGVVKYELILFQLSDYVAILLIHVGIPIRLMSTCALTMACTAVMSMYKGTKNIIVTVQL